MWKNKERVGWYFYDWANSAYSLVITSAIFPIFFSASTRSHDSDYVTLFGIQFYNTSLYSYTIALSYLIVSVITPLLSGVADYSGKKKRFLRLFCTLGSASCAALYFFSQDHLALGLLTVMMASVGFCGSLVFYNAFLPEIAEPAEQDAVSARGFSMGYIGSSILLIVNVAMISKPTLFGIQCEGMSDTEIFMMIAPWTFLMVAAWWFGWSQLTFRWLKDRAARVATENVMLAGFRELRHVWLDLQNQPSLKIFLAAFFVYSMGVQTVILVSTFFGTQVIGMKSSDMIGVLLILQIVAVGGSYLFSWLSKVFGNVRALMIALVVWIGVCISAALIDTAFQFTLISIAVGTVLGGIQSLSRSTYSKFLPSTHDHASYFSFYDVCEKVGIVLGMFIYGRISDITGNMRHASLALIIFFVCGFALLFLLQTKMQQTVRQAEN